MERQSTLRTDLFAILAIWLSSSFVLWAVGTRPTVALVLSGGGARGLAQIGVLKVLEQYQIPVDVIAGTSIGAVIGGLYAAGYSAEELENILTSIRWEELFGLQAERERTNQFLDQREEEDRSILQLRFRSWQPVLPKAISLGYRVAALFHQLVWSAPYNATDFDDLKIPFRAVATDLVSGRMVVLRRGNLARVLRASATVPIQYSPVRIDSMLLVDGGLLANVPIEAVEEFHPDVIIVVNTTSPLLPAHQLKTPWAIADQVVSVSMQRSVKAALTEADVCIEPALGDHRFTDFTDLHQLVAAGERAAREKIADIIALTRTASVSPEPELLREIGKTAERTIAQIQWIQGIVPPELDSIVCQFIGAPATVAVQQQIYEQTARWLRARHLAFAHVQWVLWHPQSQTLLLQYIPGIIDTIVVYGSRQIPEVQIRQLLSLRSGRPFRANQAIRGWKQLMNSGFFSDVDIQTFENPQKTVTVVVRVEERPTTVLRIGGIIDNERHTRVYAEIADENVFHQAHRLALGIGGGQRDFNAELRFQLSHLGNPDFSLSLHGWYRYENFYRYRVELHQRQWKHLKIGGEDFFYYGMRLRAYRRLERNGLLFGEIRLQWLKQQQREQGKEVVIPYRPSFIAEVGLLYDSRNRSDFPDSGRMIRLTFASPVVVLPKGYNFSKATFLYRQWMPITARSQLSYRFFAGFGDRIMPRAAYFRLGGITHFIGLYESQWVGTQTVQISLQWVYRLPFRILFDTDLNVRMDVSGMWNQPSAIRLANLGYALGVALRFRTPIGPAAVWIARGATYARSQFFFTPWRIFFRIGRPL